METLAVDSMDRRAVKELGRSGRAKGCGYYTGRSADATQREIELSGAIATPVATGLRDDRWLLHQERSMESNDSNSGLSRSERIREELRRAGEFGQSPRRPISVARNFRIESLTRVLVAPPVAECNAPASRLVARPIAPRRGNPYANLAHSGTLLAAVEDGLKRLPHAAREQLIPTLLADYGDYSAQAKDPEQLKALQQRVLQAVFGEDFFKNMRGASAKEHKSAG
jgi:hypothetical protein